MNSEEIEGLRFGLSDVHISPKPNQQILNEIVPNSEKKLLKVMVADNKRHVYVIENQTAGQIRCLPRQENKPILNTQNKNTNVPENANPDQSLKHVTHLEQHSLKYINNHENEQKNTGNKQREMLQEMPNKIPILNKSVSPEVPVRKCRNALINALIKKEQDRNQACTLQPDLSKQEKNKNKVKANPPRTSNKLQRNIPPVPNAAPIFDMHAFLMDDSNFVFVPLPQIVYDDNKCTYTIRKHNTIENLLQPAEACTKTGLLFNKPRIMNPDSYFAYAQSARKDLLKNLYHNARPIYDQQKSEFILKENNFTKTKKTHYIFIDSSISNGTEQEEKFKESFKQPLPFKKSRNALINGLVKKQQDDKQKARDIEMRKVIPKNKNSKQYTIYT